MVSEDPNIDELILQVFEEHEDMFFWPVSSQKDAKTFVKFIHEKGAPYEEICKEIDEFEHNFSAWRKGLGRVGIGTRMIDRINKTVESVIESDDEDNLQFNLKQLAKVNKKHDNKAQKSKAAKEKSQSVAAVSKEPKQQQNDLMNSMSKNIDKHSERTTQASKHQEPAKKEDVQKPVKQEEPIKKSEPLVNGSTAAKVETPTKQEPVPAKREPVPAKREPVPAKREEPKQEIIVQQEPVVEKVAEKQQATQKVQPKAEEKVSPVPAKRSSTVEADKVETPQENDEEKKTEDKPAHHEEVDEVKKKMEAIRKKVEMMKRQKAEKQAGTHPPSEQSDGQAASHSAQSPSAGADSDKYEAMRKRIEELRNKIKTEEEQHAPETAHDDEQVPPKPRDIPLSPKVESAPSVSAAPPIVAVEEDLQPEVAEEETAEEEATPDDIYDSDLDPDNYDSDLEYDIHKEVQKLANLVQSEKSRQRERDGPGHLYIYSDSPPDERKHRIKIGATRSPDKKFRQAQSFNPSFKMVSCTAVSKRKAALKEVHNVLDKYKLESYSDWFSGPIDKILQYVSTVTEKYGSGPALSSFQTDSQC